MQVWKLQVSIGTTFAAALLFCLAPRNLLRLIETILSIFFVQKYCVIFISKKLFLNFFSYLNFSWPTFRFYVKICIKICKGLYIIEVFPIHPVRSVRKMHTHAPTCTCARASNGISVAMSLTSPVCNHVVSGSLLLYDITF